MNTCTYIASQSHFLIFGEVICFSLSITCTPDNITGAFLVISVHGLSYHESTVQHLKGRSFAIGLKTTGTIDNVLGAMERNYSFIVLYFCLLSFFRR